MVNRIRNENGSSCALEGAIPIFLKVLLFHSSGRGNHHDDATLNFISDSSSCMLGLSNEISFVSVFFLECGQNSQNVKLNKIKKINPKLAFP